MASSLDVSLQRIRTTRELLATARSWADDPVIAVASGKMSLKVLAISKSRGTVRLIAADRLSMATIDVINQVSISFECIVAVWTPLLLVIIACDRWLRPRRWC